MKIKRLTQEKNNGRITLVKKDIDFDMLSPVIAKVLIEVIEQLAEFEKRAISDELLEIPYPIKSKIELHLDNQSILCQVIGYEVTAKDLILLLETKDKIIIRLSYRENYNYLKKIGSVNVT